MGFSPPSIGKVIATDKASQPVVPAAAGVVIVTAIIAALYYGSDILIPVSLAVLLSFAIAPLVRRLQRTGLGRVPAVLLAVMTAFIGLAFFGGVVGGQVMRLAENLPDYQDNILAKLSALQELSPSGRLFDRALRMVEEVSAELPAVATGGSPSADAVTVQLSATPANPLAMLKNVAIPLLAPIGTAGVVIVLVVFMLLELLEREDLRDRLIRLFGEGDLQHTTQALNDAASRVSRYLLTQLLVNATYGIPIGVGLWFIGVPNALLWGLLATVLLEFPRFRGQLWARHFQPSEGLLFVVDG